MSGIPPKTINLKLPNPNPFEKQNPLGQHIKHQLLNISEAEISTHLNVANSHPATSVSTRKRWPTWNRLERGNPFSPCKTVQLQRI